MTVSISTSPSGNTYAFSGEPMRACIMCHGTPVVDATFYVADLQRWTTTLEEVLPSVDICHYGALSAMLARLQVVLDNHDKQHQQIVTEAPTAEDQMAYLASYLKAMAPKGV